MDDVLNNYIQNEYIKKEKYDKLKKSICATLVLDSEYAKYIKERLEEISSKCCSEDVQVMIWNLQNSITEYGKGCLAAYRKLQEGI